MSKVKHLEQHRNYERMRELLIKETNGIPLTFKERNVLNIMKKRKAQHDKRSGIR